MERALVELARGGDQDAYEALVHLAADRLYGIAYRILREPAAAEDALQNALVAIWEDLPELRDPDRFDAWSYRLVVRASYREAARGRRWSRDARVVRILPALVVPDDADRIGNRDALDVAFRRLTPDHRAVVVLHFYLGLQPTEIAASLGIPVGTAGSRLHYALRELRGAFEADARGVATWRPTA